MSVQVDPKLLRNLLTAMTALAAVSAEVLEALGEGAPEGETTQPPKRGKKPDQEPEGGGEGEGEGEGDDGGFDGKPEKPKKGKAKAPTADDVRDALKALSAAKGRPAAMKLLKKYGVESIPDLDTDNYAELIEKANELADA